MMPLVRNLLGPIPSRPRNRVTVLLSALFTFASCGEEPGTIVVSVNVGDLQVPAEVDSLHFVVSDIEGIYIERTFELVPGELPTLALYPGEGETEGLTVEVLGLKDGLIVGSSTSEVLRFTPGETSTLELLLVEH
jgi:hypothetical protein